VLLKERTRLQAEKAMYRQQQQRMPNVTRVAKVRKAMCRIKLVLSERIKEHEDPNIRMELKAFIDAM
jgi:ribosomal protein L29